MADWVTISSLATAGGTLVLATATFASVKSANRAARVAERSFQVGLRPVLVPTRQDDPVQKVGWMEGRYHPLPGGAALFREEDDNVYIALSVRNVGSGLAVLHGGYLVADRVGIDEPHADLDEFRFLQRDLYVPAGDQGFWQVGLRDPDDALRRDLLSRLHERQPITVELLYGDHEGGQRTVTRFAALPRGEDAWACAVMRHWTVEDELHVPVRPRA
jgi:hypothetical protein